MCGNSKKRQGITMKKTLSLASLVLVLLMLTTRPAHAYLDPASGSMILQVIVAAVAALLITIKAFWHKIRGMFGSSPTEETIDTDDKS